MNEPAGLDLELAALTPAERYKILCGAIVPRPIAWVTSVSPDGVVNAAPFSFFNVFSEDPPLLVLGLQHRADGSLKDTTANVHAGGEFVVQLIDETLADAMHASSAELPRDVSEPEKLGLRLAASVAVVPPRLADAPFAFECRRTVSLAFGPGRELLVGEALHVHARAGLLDADTLRVDFERYRPVGRLFGDLYTRQRDVFALRG
jgi:flavin reductase (DIM6/NTAB) family NADH-FMN oxidoreductase RutF